MCQANPKFRSLLTAVAARQKGVTPVAPTGSPTIGPEAAPSGGGLMAALKVRSRARVKR